MSYKVALDYFNMGFSIIPIQQYEKKPIVKWEEFQNRRPTEEEVSTWFKDDKPNIAVVCGRVSGNLIGLDFETEEAFRQFFNLDILKNTLVVKTPHRGIHVWLREDGEPPRRSIRITDEPPLDLLGEGGYALLPPSSIDHTNCNKNKCKLSGVSKYEVISTVLEPMRVKGIFQAVLERARELGWKIREKPRIAEIVQGVPEGIRNISAFHYARYLLFKIRLQPDVVLHELKRWNVLNKPPLPEKELETVWKSAQKYPYLPPEANVELFKPIAIEDLTVLPMGDDYSPIHPAVGVVGETAYVGVWITSSVSVKPKKDGENPKVRVQELPYLVTRNRELILANETILRQRGWQLSYRPLKLLNRWRIEEVKRFLSGEDCDPAEVFLKVLEAWRTYLEFQDEREYLLHAVWDVGTYFHVLFKTYPYLYIGGVKRSGKSKALTLHSCIAFNAFFSNNMSTPSIYRLIQNARGTLLIDETEKLSSPDRALEFRSILLAGYKRGAVVYRVEKTRGEILIPQAFEVYSPKALANISGLEDVMEDRCITTIMKRGKNPEVVNREIDVNSEDWSRIRSGLYRLFLLHWGEVRGEYDRLDELSEPSVQVNFLRERGFSGEVEYTLSSRELELWKPLLAVASFLEKSPPQTKFTCSLNSLCSQLLQLAMEKSRERNVENMTETGELILVQVLSSLVSGNGYYRVKDIRDEMARQFDEEQKWLTTKWVGNALRRLGFREKRRVGTGYEYYLTPWEVGDIAERMGVNIQPTFGDRVNKARKIFQRLKNENGLVELETFKNTLSRETGNTDVEDLLKHLFKKGLLIIHGENLLRWID